MEQAIAKDTDAVETALALHCQGFNGAQAVLSAFCKEMGIDRDQALKLGAGLGSGIGTLQTTCSTLCAGLMVLGCRCFDPEAPIESRQLQYEEDSKLLLHFYKLFGSVECRDLLGINLTKPGGLKEARQKRVFQTRCPLFVKEVCRYLETHSHTP
jgi:C_GCAxxG_C_C family probable redox protein